ncbi:MAG: hypothetical protein FJY07_01680, partial [Bacteroidetes bacterium]|nr:hypothetical protein [Bacteroidota bacterium]
MLVPAGANFGNTFARFRLSTVQGLNYTGAAANGEVEDYMVTIQPAELMDYGDAPDPLYRTLAASNGARHNMMGPDNWMGNVKDLEMDGQPDAGATGDDINPLGGLDDEDGVVLNTPLIPGLMGTVTITVNMLGPILQGWIDFNADGDWLDAGEQILTNVMPPNLVWAYNFNIPAGATLGMTYARFRISTMNSIPSFGPAPNGEVEDYKYYIGEEIPMDYGDAPDPSYPTFLVNDGARHSVTGLFMGVLVDQENDGQPDATATGDDLNPFGFDDEDGVWWPINFAPGQANTVKVTTNGAGFLSAWFDYNINGSWADFGEKIFSDVSLNAGTTDLTVNVPVNAAIGTTFMRFRFSTQQNLTYTGLAQDGEVEDHQVIVEAPILMEYGDNPDLNYQTLAANNGARHAQGPPFGIFMGALKDFEIDGQPDPFAKGDDNNPPGANNDEDGVIFNTPFIPGAPAQVTITVSVTGAAIQGWIDFNADGDFLDAGEQVITNFVAFNFINVINFNIPIGALTGSTFARFRYSTMGNLAPYGGAPNGEVEDYKVTISALITDTPVDPDPNGLYTQNEISMALLHGVQPGIPAVLLAAYNDQPYPGGPGLGIAYSTDGGATWNNTHLSYPPDPYSGGFFVDQFDPTATADANGNIIVGHISTDYDWINGPASGLYVEISSDGGVTWSGPIAVATDGPPLGNPDPNYRFNDRCQITADIYPGSPYFNNIYIVEIKDRGWNNPLLQSDIYFSTSTDGGLTWSPQVILNGAQSSMANMPVPAVAPDGTVYVCWMDYNVQTGGIGKIYLDISYDGGATWLANDILVRSVNLPPIRLNGGTDNLTKGAAVIGVSPFNSQEVYITYAEQNMMVMDEADIFFIKSMDAGLNWSVPLRVNDDLTVSDQVLPWMDVKSNGIIDIGWYDRRNDPADLLWDVYIAMSTDGGNSFGANQIITNISSPTPNTPSGLWMGEYLGLVTDNAYAYITFCQALTDAKGDIYFDKIQNPVMHEIDYGDAMDPTYPTLVINNGARHVIDGITFLGGSVDPDGDGQPDPMAMGDDNDGNDDEDGVTFNWPLGKGNPCKLTVVASVSGAFLSGWIDFNLNGSWAEAGEQVFTDISLLAGLNDLTFNVPTNAALGWTFARFRFSTQTGLSYTGLASNGEVEDYYVEITENPDYKWSQYPEVTLPGLHAHDAVIPPYQSIVLADDWQCNGGVVTDIHWWGNYELDMLGQERRGSGINNFHISIHLDDPTGMCLPVEPELVGFNVPFSSIVEQNTGLPNNEGCPIYYYQFILPSSFNQELGARYWIDISAFANDPNNPAIWRWQESRRSYYPILCGAANKTNPSPGTWSTITWNAAPPYRYSDMAFIITSAEVTQLDFGDLPDGPYPTLLLNNGPRHLIGQLFLGNQIDAEGDGLPHPSALGDDNSNFDDEDGVVFVGGLFPAEKTYVSVQASQANGLLQGWIDFNSDGDFNDAGEQIFQNVPLNAAGAQMLSFTTDPNAGFGITFARFRLSTVVNLGYTGAAPDGEVEDYEVVIRHPVAIWRLDENLGNVAYDATLYDNDAAITGATWVPGYSNSALSFNGGSDYATAQHSPSLDITSPFTAQAWIKCSGLQHYYAIVDKLEYTPAGSRGFTMYLTGGQLRLSVYSGAAGDGDVFGTSELRDNTYHHVMASWDGSYLRAYVDGILEGEVAWANAPVSTTQNIGIGMRLSGWGGYMPFDGIIDEVIISAAAPPEFDFGDAADPSYPTMYANNGARHIPDGVTFLGLGVDPDNNGQPDPNALGDDNDEGDDEEGVTVIFPLTPGGTGGFDITASIMGNLNGWIDYNADGSWDDSGEQVFIDQILYAGSNWMLFSVPANAVVGPTFARFRFSTVAGLSYTGEAPDGEVEDHEINIEGELG